MTQCLCVSLCVFISLCLFVSVFVLDVDRLQLCTIIFVHVIII